VAAILAAIMARAGVSVTLLDADLEGKALSAMVNGGAVPVTSVGEARESDDQSSDSGTHPVPAVPPHRLRVLLTYPQYGETTAWMAPDRLEALVGELKSKSNTLVVSAPPLPAAETTVLTGLVDAVIIAVTVGQTRRDRLTQLCEDLAERGVAVGFVVLERASLSATVARHVKKPERWA
jgi:Mrp family chromosome partitioning ATPase